MQQYFVNTIVTMGSLIKLEEEQAHHIVHVLRMKEDTCIRLADQNEQLFFAHVHMEGRNVFAKATCKIADTTKNKIHMTLAQGLIKGDKWDYLLQKSAELGVNTIVPFVSSRCVVKAKVERTDKKKRRWEKILLEACEQCRRSSKVRIEAPIMFPELCTKRAPLKLIAYEEADRKSERLCDVLTRYPNVEAVLVVVGCEGGFSKEEVATLCACGYHQVSLGSRILRAETAALALLNSLSFFYEMKGG